jgi:RsiW-degrading membrane proteinase PrsW (M82 family)
MLAPDLVFPAIVAAATAPALLLLWLVVAADSRPEPARMVLIAVLLGALSAAVAAAVELSLTALLPMAHAPLLAAWENGMFLAGIPEETLKVSLIAAIASRTRAFDEPMDGVVYGAAVGLGFAALENIGYVAGDTHWQGIAVMRALISVPFHGALGVIAGAYIARARFAGVLGSGHGAPWHRTRLFVSAWLVPAVLHSVFDGSLFSLGKFGDAPSDTDALWILLFALLALVTGFGSIVVAIVLTRRIARRQKAWLPTRRLPPAHWRGVWAECLLGIGMSFVAVTLVVAGGPGAKFAGLLLLAVAVWLSRKGARYLNDAATSRRHLAVAAAPSPPA